MESQTVSRSAFPARPYVAHWRPVEEFERPLKGDPDESREIRGQRAIFLYMLIMLVVCWFAWRAIAGGAA